MFSRGNCVRQELQGTCYENAALQSDFTFPLSVTFRCRFWSWKDRSPEEYVSAVLQKIRVIPTEQPYIFKKSLFCWLCWAVWYTREIAQPHRITRSSGNNHCFTICLTHCEQGSLQHNRNRQGRLKRDGSQDKMNSNCCLTRLSASPGRFMILSLGYAGYIWYT